MDKSGAWLPPISNRGLTDLLVIRHPAVTRLTSEDYRGLLAIRFQGLIDRQTDPQEATDDVAAILAKSGAFPADATVDAEDAGAVLIYSNPAIPEFLSLMGLEPGPYLVTDSNATAEMALMRDKQPQGRPQHLAMLLRAPSLEQTPIR